MIGRLGGGINHPLIAAQIFAYARKLRRADPSKSGVQPGGSGYAPGMAGLVVIGYDGSQDAQRAVDLAGAALRADAALVVNVWSTPIAITQPGAGFGAPSPPSEAELGRLEQAARQVAEEGAARARRAGLSAEAVVAQGASAEEIAKTLCDLAETRDAILVVGRRGVSRLKELVLGSVSNAAVHDGRRPVLVVPDGER